MTTYSNILMILQKINSWKHFSAMHEECALLCVIIIIIIIVIIIILSWNYIVFCIKRALGVENKMALHATFSFGDCTVKWNKQKTSMCCHKKCDLIEFLLTKFIRK